MRTSVALPLIALTMLCTCRNGEKGEATSSIKFTQYFLQGEKLYIANCSNCHQKNGKGLGLVYPPLDQSDYLDNHFEEVLCLIRYGRKGSLTVNGKTFNKEMKGVNALTDLEIAEITTFLYNSWDRKRGIVDVKDAARLLNACEPQ